MKNTSAGRLLLVVALMFGVAACSSTGQGQKTGAYVDDSWITTKVKTVLVDSPLVKAREVNVETFKGAVQLSGFVSSESAMNEAVRLTRDIKGVTSVKNDMRIK